MSRRGLVVLMIIRRRSDMARALTECSRLLRSGMARGVPRTSVPLALWMGPPEEPPLPAARIEGVPIHQPVIVASARWPPTWSLSWLGFATAGARAGRDAQRRAVLSAIALRAPTAGRFLAVYANHERGAREKRRSLFREFGDVVDRTWIALDTSLRGQIFVDLPAVLH